MKMALEGIRVGDWTVAAAGSSATMWLSALGAEVIKIEYLEGETSRNPRIGELSYGVSVAGAKNVSTWWEVLNCNKKSLTANLKTEKGREIIYRLVKTLDVFVTNQLPDTIEKLGMGYETLEKHNSRLIYGELNLFGPKGPRRLVPAHDPIGMAISGIMMTSGGRGDPPTLASPGVGDYSGGFSMTCAIIAALLHRERTGEAQKVEASQLQACMNIISLTSLGQYLLRTQEQREQDPHYGEPKQDRREDPYDAARNYYKCKDDRWVHISPMREKHWKPLCQAIGQPELAEDPKFNTRKARHENRRELFAFFEQLFASKTLAEWDERFQGVDCCFTPVNRLRDLPNEPQVIANEYLFTFEHPVIGRCQWPGAPFTMRKTPASIRAAAPALGEHTDEILLELDYTPEEVVQLHEEQVV